jgi:hypothetical protein
LQASAAHLLASPVYTHAPVVALHVPASWQPTGVHTTAGYVHLPAAHVPGPVSHVGGVVHAVDVPPDAVQPPHESVHVKASVPSHTQVPEPHVVVHVSPSVCASVVHPLHALSSGATHSRVSAPLQVHVPVQPSAPGHVPPTVSGSVLQPPHAFFATQEVADAQHLPRELKQEAAVHSHVPLSHASPFPHRLHVPPLAPHVSMLCVSQMVPSQHPSGQDVPSQTHAPSSVQRWP